MHINSIIVLYMNRLIHDYRLKIENLDAQSHNILFTTPLTLHSIIWGVQVSERKDLSLW